MSGFPLSLVSLLSFGSLGSAVAAAPRPRYGSSRPTRNHKANADKKRKRKLAEKSRKRNRC